MLLICDKTWIEILYYYPFLVSEYFYGIKDVRIRNFLRLSDTPNMPIQNIPHIVPKVTSSLY